MSFASLKKSRGSSLEKLVKESEKLKSGDYSDKDNRFWQPQVDKAGNGYAVIRFLPEADGDDFPYVRTFKHGFQGPGGWYIENCPTTISGKCPVCEKNTELWNSGVDANKDIVRQRKRKLSYISNIMVIKDSSNPENDGKTFLFKYGKKIWDKINESINPEFEDETPVNPFDFWEGADFKLKIRNVEGYRNYDKSEFDNPSELLNGDDEKLEEVYKNLHSLNEFVDPNTFESYEKLEAKMVRVLGESTAPKTLKEAVEESSPHKEEKPPFSTNEDDDLSFFEKLAEDD